MKLPRTKVLENHAIARKIEASTAPAAEDCQLISYLYSTGKITAETAKSCYSDILSGFAFMQIRKGFEDATTK